MSAAARGIIADMRATLADRSLAETDAIHALRVSFKRWRALTRLLVPIVGTSAEKKRIEARDLARLLAGPRDAQAALDALDDLEKLEAHLPLRSKGTIQSRLKHLRADAERPALLSDARARIASWLADAEETLTQWPLDSVEFADFAAQLSRGYRRAQRRIPTGWKEADPETLHELRQAAIDHRYQMELAEPFWPKLMTVWVDETQRLRSRLGAYNDLEALKALTAPRAPLAHWRAQLTPRIAERQAEHLRSARRLTRRLFAEQPKAFRKRIEAIGA